MLSEYKTKTNIGVGIGVVLQIGGQVAIASEQQVQVLLALVAILAGFVTFLWGCVQYAKGKGQSGWLGALGILSIIGLIVLALLPDRHKSAEA